VGPVPPYPAEPAPRRRRGLVVVLAAVLVGIVAVAAFLALSKKNNGQSNVAATTVAPNPSQVANALNKLIQDSTAARTQVVNTVASIENCSANLSSAASTLMQAVTIRQQVISTLQGLPVSGLVNGVAMRAALIEALNDSVQADHHFQDWLAGITANGGCTNGKAPLGPDWQAGEASSNAASTAKQTFATLWNPVASTYGLPRVSSTTI
jgi:flagellar basal body-associated protein FliL